MQKHVQKRVIKKLKLKNQLLKRNDNLFPFQIKNKAPNPQRLRALFFYYAILLLNQISLKKNLFHFQLYFFGFEAGSFGVINLRRSINYLTR